MQAAPATDARPARKTLPPGPKGTLWQTLHFLRDPRGFFAAQYRRYGDPCTLFSAQGPLVITANPELVRTMFTADPDTFEPWPVSLLGVFFGERSVIMSAGERHRRDRKLLTPPFNGARMRAYGHIIVEATRHATLAWSDGWRGSVHTATTAISLDVILRAVFGIDQADARARAETVVRQDVEAIRPSILFVPALRRELLGRGPWSRFVRTRRELDALLYREIAARHAHASRGGEPREDILSLIVGARYDDGSAMSDSEIRDQLITLLAAGHETTATALAWALYWTHRDPAIAADLRAEIAGLGAGAEPDAIAALPRLDAVCTETLRLRPIVSDVARRLRKPLVFGDYEVPANAGVGVTIATMHYDPKLYAEPERFDPARFLGTKPPMFGYAPFGGGARRCLGAAFATYEMKIVLATLLTTFDFELLDRNVVPMRRNVTMGPRGGVRMRVVRRRG
jgi:cytochrome P450 family 110